MPRVVDHDQRRRDLARAACAVIARAGLEGTTLRDVATEAGCTTGMVSHYYTDKQQLLIAALDAVAQAVGDRILARVVSDPGDLRAVLAESLPLDEPRHVEWKVWIAFWGAAVGDPVLRREHRGHYLSWHQALTAVIGPNSTADEASDTAAEALMIAVDGIGLRAALDPASWPPRRQLVHLDRAIAAATLLSTGPPAGA
jgi:AcrR family transcriptional regulator